jgi:hypothetical protein
VWAAVSQWLAPSNADLEYWWKLTGPQVAHMMVAAGYSTEAQYNALLFHYHWIVRPRHPISLIIMHKSSANKHLSSFPISAPRPEPTAPSDGTRSWATRARPLSTRGSGTRRLASPTCATASKRSARTRAAPSTL